MAGGPSGILETLKTNNLFEKEVLLKRNEFLKVAGTIDTNIYFIEEGSLRVYISQTQEEQIIRFGYQNDLIVSLDSFLTEQPSDFYIQAIKKTSVKVISKRTFFEFITENEDNLKLWNAILENLVLQQMEREKDLLIASVNERYSRVLKRSPRLFQEIPHKYIANYLRMTPETLSRLKKS
ncbi:cyclic nucleotide-binding protein [Flavobacterium saliperosum S13]|uniref:cAMP-binding domain of CRP or a regulatory subunit of cAMP-dependent protein kinases n=2 Tax=Flavobacterium saliperosum TaxID=329186 RepID=A0A1G4VEJ2_9FLAO|nr:Crp/Fnr family transcriptional regulator [Flavobacterium saliperosum]ESU25783.1 cyclic nucleotide-binding protein [Flavobacterium saliperosum S13]SCX05573.1 cAMP-binding domain of CRP or a regulatory subunit of cAMP-dependent protein kinases [Flavobacterium saliperosum]